MKRALSITVAVASFCVLGIAFAAGVPEIDRANATFNLDPVGSFTSTSCPGEDATNFVTFHGRWQGAENEPTPGFTDYNLTGTIAVSNVAWTINLKTKRGVLNATATLTEPASGARVYSGRLTLITQGLPGSALRSRGWIIAGTFTGGVADGGSLLANVEVSFDPALVGSGTFGDAAPPKGFPNFSVTTANQTC